jgi:hypothetical protein
MGIGQLQPHAVPRRQLGIGQTGLFPPFPKAHLTPESEFGTRRRGDSFPLSEEKINR